MAFGVVAFHYPKPEHRDELLERLARAAEVVAATPGCTGADSWIERDSGALVTTGWFDSEGAWDEAVAAVLAAGVDFAYDEREAKPRDVYFLTEPASRGLM